MADATAYPPGFEPPAGVDEAGLARLVDSFYARVREDELLGPIFNREIEDWPAHLAKLKDFWSSIMLQSGRYDGRPLPPHLQLPEISDAHFSRWLDLFHQTANEEMAPMGSEAVSAMAGRIATSFRIAIAMHRGQDASAIRPL
ncbi:MAG: group III truncated hemoglobin [Rhodoblastus sp.]